MCGSRSAASGGADELRHVAEESTRKLQGLIEFISAIINGTVASPADSAQAEQIGMKDFISAHPLGLDLPIAEGGRGLSGGQRTLANLVRLFLARPGMWLLDEPTANLDQGTEARVI